MKVTCKTKGCVGDEFWTVAHVTEDWKVDKDGEYLDRSSEGGEVVHGPTKGNNFACAKCGVSADVED